VHVKQAGYVIIVIGLFSLTFSLGAVISELGGGGFPAGQLLGVGISVIVSLIGLVLIVADQRVRFDLDELKQRLSAFISDVPVAYWIVAGFLVSYFSFFIFPIFLNSGQQFQYFKYLPEGPQIGMDIRAILSLVRDWAFLHQNHYADGWVWYPPFYNLFFVPLIFLRDQDAYVVITFATILCYFFLVLVTLKLVNPRHNKSLLSLFFISGIVSYGFQFELERGQYNVIAFLFCLLAVYIFYYHEKFRYFAYLLFTLAVQLKIYPAIFVILFIKDWRSWKNNIKRMLGLGLLNFAALFILGYSVFVDFVKITIFPPFGESMYWVGNHSVKSFVHFLDQNRNGPLSGRALLLVQNHPGLLEIALLAYFGLCLLAIIGVAYWRRENGLNTYLLLACTIGMLIIPSVSHDYKLTLLIAPMSIAFGDLILPAQTSKRIISYLLIFAASVAYSAMLFPPIFRPQLIENSLPLLFIILTTITLLYVLKPFPKRDSDTASPELELEPQVN